MVMTKFGGGGVYKTKALILCKRINELNYKQITIKMLKVIGKGKVILNFLTYIVKRKITLSEELFLVSNNKNSFLALNCKNRIKYHSMTVQH